MKLKITCLLIALLGTFEFVFSQDRVPNSTERRALRAIYDATHGENWTQPWTISDINAFPHSALHGVTVQNGDIESIRLVNNNLIGSLPAELNDLTELYYLEIRNNAGLTGTVPNLSGLTKLSYLDLSSNNLQGSIPTSIGNLSSLQTLYLYNNHLTGPIPRTISRLQNLVVLNLDHTDLGSSNSVPSSLDSISTLLVLSLQSCNLSATSFEASLTGLHSVENFDLSDNPLLFSTPGNSPPALINMPHLLTLIIRNSNVRSLPDHLDQLPSLNYFDLGVNDYSDPNVMSGIVDKIKGLSKLKTLLFNNCQVSNLPSNFSQLSQVINLFLAYNPLNSPQGIEVVGYMPSLTTLHLQEDFITDLPASFSQLSTLKTLDVGGNRLYPLPQVIKDIPNLNELNLGGNAIGPLPDWFGSGHMSSLTWLNLGLNEITLPLPDNMRYLTNLTYLSLANNKLSGRLPSFVSGYTKLNYVYLQHNKLTGAVPASLSNNPFTKYWVDLSYNAFDTLATFLPDPSLYLFINNNRLNFTNILKVGLPLQRFVYSPQDTLLSELVKPNPISMHMGDTLRLTATIDLHTTPASVYQWYKYVDGVHDISLSQPSTITTFVYPNISFIDGGKYYYKVTNSAVPGLTIPSRLQPVVLLPCKAEAPFLKIYYTRVACAYRFIPPSFSKRCSVLSYKWNFGDGKTSSLKQPLHGYNDAGTYTVSLSLSWKCGAYCSADTVISRQIVFDPYHDTYVFRDSVVQVVSDLRPQVLASSASTFADAWPLAHANQNLSNVNPFLNGTLGVWRNEGNHVYKVPRLQSSQVNIAQDGTYTLEQFNWQSAELNVIPNWIKANTMTQYSPYSYELENMDVLGVYSAALYDYGGHLPSANGVNMRNNEMAFTSFEYLDGNASGNWLFGTLPMPAYTTYEVQGGNDNVAFIKTSVGNLAGVFTVDVKGRSLIPEPGKSLFFHPYTLVQSDSLVCHQVFPSDHRLSVIVLKQAPMPGFWKGNITIKNLLDSIVSPTIDNTFAHSGISSLHITAPQKFKQKLLSLDSAKAYHINLWVSVKDPNLTTPKLADDLGINIIIKNRNGIVNTTFSFQPSGPIIEGWQQIRGTFVCPIGNSQVEISFLPGSKGSAWYDDLRLHPDKGNMKSYVYDLNDYRLTATLDEENYASFYFYDKEGKLYLVKKETERGVKTISENINYIIER